MEKQATPENNPGCTRSTGDIGTNVQGDERWVKTARWAIRGSRLLSPFSVGLALERIVRGHVTRAKAAPLQVPFLRLLRIFAAISDPLIGAALPPTPRHYRLTGYSPGQVGLGIEARSEG